MGLARHENRRRTGGLRTDGSCGSMKFKRPSDTLRAQLVRTAANGSNVGRPCIEKCLGWRCALLDRFPPTGEPMSVIKRWVVPLCVAMTVAGAAGAGNDTT